MPDIYTITLNPVVDLIYCVSSFEKGDTVRSRAFECVPAGKGLNVTTVLAALGVPSTAYMLLGGNDEDMYRRYCDKRGVEMKAVTGGFSVRRHCTILEDGGGVTHVQTRGCDVQKKWADELVEQLLSSLGTDDYVVISGSLPPGLPDDYYYNLIEQCRMCGALTILDASGPALMRGAKSHPYAVKINQEEAEELSGRNMNGAQQEFAALQAVHQISNIPFSVITLGSRGLIAGCEDGVWRMNVEMNPGEIHDSVGCGDALAAGLVVGMIQDLPPEDMFKTAIAAASAAVKHVGPGWLDRKQLEAMKARVKSRKIGEL
ncbi:MAG: hexose kinase [Candidatus Hinthialibacter antarcticus]|nr:hexose kinase [Candidatus Hinthialibacter antarcticus]